MAGAIVTAGSDRWGTPRALFDALNDEFDFTVDAAADFSNALLCDFYGPGSAEHEDALTIDWTYYANGEKPARAFLNPPFSLGAKFIEKAVEQAARGCLVVCLLPANKSEQGWFHELVLPWADEVRFIRGRLKYEREGGAVGATFPSCIVVFRPYLTPHGPRFFSADRLGRIVQPMRSELAARKAA